MPRNIWRSAWTREFSESIYHFELHEVRSGEMNAHSAKDRNSLKSTVNLLHGIPSVGSELSSSNSSYFSSSRCLSSTAYTLVTIRVTQSKLTFTIQSSSKCPIRELRSFGPATVEKRLANLILRKYQHQFSIPLIPSGYTSSAERPVSWR